jgi:tRNA-dihydrouridine synthase
MPAGASRRHVELLTEAMDSERDACTDFGKHVAWYLKGFRSGPTCAAGSP